MNFPRSTLTATRIAWSGEIEVVAAHAPCARLFHSKWETGSRRILGDTFGIGGCYGARLPASRAGSLRLEPPAPRPR
jgi:hypothetical protein